LPTTIAVAGPEAAGSGYGVPVPSKTILVAAASRPLFDCAAVGTINSQPMTSKQTTRAAAEVINIFTSKEANGPALIVKGDAGNDPQPD
jgi:hypothetical protein